MGRKNSLPCSLLESKREKHTKNLHCKLKDEKNIFIELTKVSNSTVLYAAVPYSS